MTVDTYRHLIPETIRQASDRLNQDLAIAPITSRNLNGLSLCSLSEHRGIAGDVVIPKDKIVIGGI